MQVNNLSLTQLQEQRGQLVTQARDALTEIRGNTDDARAAELEARHDTIMGDLDRLDAQISREQRVAAAEARQAELTEQRERENRNRRPLNDGIGSNDEPTDGDGISYRAAFHQFLQAQGNLGVMSAEARSVLNKGYHAVPADEQRAQITSTNSLGGFTVPTEMLPQLIKSMVAWGPMYSEDVCTVITTNGGGAITMPTTNDTAVTADAAPAQGTTFGDTGAKDVTFAQKQLDAFAFQTQWLRISRELADDSILAMESVIADLLGERLGRVANAQLTTGIGTGAPQGVVGASNVGLTAASATALTADELIDIVHRLDPAYRAGPKVAYMFNDAILNTVRKMKAAGTGDYIWQMGNIQQGVPPTLNGYRYHINQAMAATIAATTRSVLFGDFSKYFVRKVGAPLVGAIQDKDFWPGFGMAGWIRFDGELADNAAIRHIVH